jgi:hypothetical protein
VNWIPSRMRRPLLALTFGVLGAVCIDLSGHWLDSSWSLDGVGLVGNITVTMATLLLGWRCGMFAATVSVTPQILLAVTNHSDHLAGVLFISLLTIVEAGFLGWCGSGPWVCGKCQWRWIWCSG